MDNFYTVKQIAFILKVHPLSVRRYIREKKLAAVKVAGSVRVRDDALIQFQKEYSTRETKPAVNSQPVKFFSFDDPLWRLDGVGISLNSPQYDNQ